MASALFRPQARRSASEGVASSPGCECQSRTRTSPARFQAVPPEVHHNEDEWFYVTEGELTFWIGGQLTDAPADSFVYGPRGIPHTFTVTSPEARFLLVTEPAGFEGFMRALSEPAQSLTLPPATIPPPDPERMMAIATEYGIEILGPPGIPT